MFPNHNSENDILSMRDSRIFNILNVGSIGNMNNNLCYLNNSNSDLIYWYMIKLNVIIYTQCVKEIFLGVAKHIHIIGFYETQLLQIEKLSQLLKRCKRLVHQGEVIGN